MQAYVPAIVALSAAVVPLAAPVPGLAAETVEAALTELAGRPVGTGELTSADLPHGVTYPAQPATLRAQGPVDYAALAAGQNRIALTLIDTTAGDVAIISHSVVATTEAEILAVLNGQLIDQLTDELLDRAKYPLSARFETVDGSRRLVIEAGGKIRQPFQFTPQNWNAFGFPNPEDGAFFAEAQAIPERQQDTLAENVLDKDGVPVQDRLDALRATAAKSASPYSVESFKRAVIPESYTEVAFVSDGQTAYFGVSPGDTLENIALAFNTSLGATVVSVADVYAGGNFYPKAGFRFSGTRRLDFTGTSPEGLAVLGLALEFPIVGGMPVGIIAPRDTYPSLVSTDAIEDRSTGAAVGMRLTDTILRLRDQLEGLRAEFDAYRAAHP